MARSWLIDKRIIVLGLGASGQSCARWLTDQHLPFLWLDNRTAPVQLDECKANFPDAEIVTGGFDEQTLTGADIIIVSPGLPLTEPGIVAAINAGVDVVGDVELFCRIVDKPVVAVTGSNGKSTVVTFIGELLNKSGLKSVVAGNIGLPVLDALKQQADCYVLELSSFQLMTLTSLQDHVGCILNISEDHLDWHGCMDSYAEAKQRIYLNAKSIIYNREDLLTYPTVGVASVSIGLDKPSSEFEFGLFQGNVCLGTEVIASIAECPLSEAHNLFNLMAALAACQSVGADIRSMRSAIHSLNGLPHRCELVCERENVRWYNDSKATNVGAAVAAINSLSDSIDGRLWLIAGGDGKGASFTELQRLINEHGIGLITLGKDGKEIGRYSADRIEVDTLEAAVQQAKEHVSGGDVVLLSPACASIDMFTNYVERGNVFRQFVEAIA